MTNLIKRVVSLTKRLLAVQIVGILFSGVCLLCSGCATGYLGNRLHDGADIFTVSAGTGVGAKIRVGPLQVGALRAHDKIGLRGGYWLSSLEKPVMKDTCAPWPVMFGDATWPFFAQEHFTPRMELFDARHESGSTLSYQEVLRLQRHKQFSAIGAVPFFAWTQENYRQTDNIRRFLYNTQIDYVVAVGGSLRLGFNFTELVDFVLGWATVDIVEDDIE